MEKRKRNIGINNRFYIRVCLPFFLAIMLMLLIFPFVSFAGLVPEPTCYDSDGGYNIYTYGCVEYGTSRYCDRCASSNTVYEYYCASGGRYNYGETRCPQGYSCVNGVCVYSTSSSTTTTIYSSQCYDSDGYNIYIKGRTTWSSYVYEDFCFDSEHIQEYICNGNVAAPVGTVCPAGYSCRDGACVYSPTTTLPSQQYCRVHARVFNCYTNQLIGGALINLDGQTQYSSSSGYVTFYNVPVGQKTITASMSGYTSDSKSFYCSCSSDVYIDLRIFPQVTTTTTTSTTTICCPPPTTTICCPSTTTTLPKYCTFRVNVYEDSTSNPLSGAIVMLDGGNAQVTPRDGTVYYYYVSEGYHTVAASKSGYRNDSKSVYCSCGRTIDVILRLYPIITTTTSTTTSSTTTSSTTTTSTSTTIPQFCNIEVQVLYDSTTNPLPGAVVTLDGTDARITPSDGRVVYYNVPVGWHTVYASKDGYYPASQSVYCSCSQTHRVVLRLYPYITTTTTTSTTSSTSTTTSSTTTTSTTIPTGKCAGYCGGRSPYGCWCDEKCKINGDCCDDVCLGCPGLSHCGGNETYCAISVKVYNDSTENPLEGVFVYLDGGNIKATGNDGKVMYYGISKGSHTLFLTKAGFISATQFFTCDSTGIKDIVVRLYPIASSTTTTTTTSLSSSSSFSCSSCNLREYCDLEVRVVDQEFNPIASATVTLDNEYSKSTSSSGKVYYFDVPIGGHVIEVNKSGYKIATQSFYCPYSQTRSITITLSPVATTTTIQEYCHINVYVLDVSTSAPIKDAEVKLDGGGRFLTYPNGKAEYYFVVPGWRTISVSAQGYYSDTKTVNCVGGQTHEIVFRLQKISSISETNVSAQKFSKCKIVAVAVKDYTNETLADVEMTLDNEITRRTDSKGIAVFEDVSLAAHTLKAMKEGYYPDVRTVYCSGEEEAIEVVSRLYPTEGMPSGKAPTGFILFAPDITSIGMIVLLLLLIIVAFLLFTIPLKKSSEEELPEF